MSKIKKLFKLFGIVLAILIVAVVIFKLVINPFKITKAERILGLENGQIVLSYDRRIFPSELEKGDIVVFAEPNTDDAILIGVVNNVSGETIDEAVDYTTVRNTAYDTESIELTNNQYGISYSNAIYVVTDSQIKYKAWYKF